MRTIEISKKISGRSLGVYKRSLKIVEFSMSCGYLKPWVIWGN